MNPHHLHRATDEELIALAYEHYATPLIAELGKRLANRCDEAAVHGQVFTNRGPDHHMQYDHLGRIDMAPCEPCIAHIRPENEVLRMQNELDAWRLRAETAEATAKHAQTLLAAVEYELARSVPVAIQ